MLQHRVSFCVFLLFLLFLQQPFSTNALVPKVCAHNVTHVQQMCCPTHPQNHLVCGGAVRGECRDIQIYPEPERDEYILSRDDRFEWPRHFFRQMCHCNGNYFGIACEQCQFGWSGENCDQKKTYTRRNIFSFSPRERRLFQKVLLRAETIPSQFVAVEEKNAQHSDPLRNPHFLPLTVHQYYAFLHYYAFRSTLFDDTDTCGEQNDEKFYIKASFAPWHRAFILLWERSLRDIAEREFDWPDFALPYWDWVDATDWDVCTDDLVGAPGEYLPDEGLQLLSEGSPFHKRMEYCIAPNRNPPGHCMLCHGTTKRRPLNREFLSTDFPTTNDIVTLLSKKGFERPLKTADKQCLTFHDALEGACGSSDRPESAHGNKWMHTMVHLMINGSFGTATNAGEDPLILLHHSQLDRLYQSWYALYAPHNADEELVSRIPGHAPDSFTITLFPLIRNRDMFVDLKDLGVQYDNYRYGKWRVSY